MPKTPLPFEEDDDVRRSSPRPHRAGRGFFAVLALCLVAIGGVAASTFSDAVKAPPTEPSSDTTTTRPTVRTTDVAAAAPTVAPTTTTVTTTAPTVPTEPKALVALPLNGAILAPFSEQPFYNETMDDYRAHTALDLDGEEDQAVLAIAEGTIESTEEDPLWGPCLTVDHGEGMRSVYRGVRSTLSIGSHVEAGHVLGKLAAVPCEAHLGPHLHLELYKEGSAVDPAVLLGELLPTTTA